MAAFFAINIDSFPFNDNGKLPLDYVLKYMRRYLSRFALLTDYPMHANANNRRK